MNQLKALSENKTFFLFLWVTVCFLLFLNGVNSFISSSEFWSIYLSQKIFSFHPTFKSVYLKPLFHLILSSIYLLDLNDFYHIYATKILFSINGILQFFLIYKILSCFYKNNLANFFLTVFIFCSPLFLANYDRIRSDQVALTIFLTFLFINFSSFIYKNKLQLILLIALPLIAFKHIYFLVLGLFFLPIRAYLELYKNLTTLRKTIAILFLVNFFLWLLYFSIPALDYLLNSFETYEASIQNLLLWMKTEWFYLYLSLLPFFLKNFRTYLNQKNIANLFYIEFFIILFFLLHPQKFNFFIASFLPILYLPSVFFIYYLAENNLISLQKIFPVLLFLSLFSLHLARKQSHFFTLNNPQLIAIDRISNIVTKNNLTYLDGVGILPRGRNMGCFVSPDDDYTNQGCIQTIKTKSVDAIILTNRLMSLDFDFNKLEEFDYVAIGPNFFVRKNLVSRFKNESTDWPPPSLIFSSEQLY